MAMFKASRSLVWCVVCGVACKDNSKVGGCGVSVVWLVLISVMMIGWFVGVVDRWSGD